MQLSNWFIVVIWKNCKAGDANKQNRMDRITCERKSKNKIAIMNVISYVSNQSIELSKYLHTKFAK